MQGGMGQGRTQKGNTSGQEQEGAGNRKEA